MTANMGANPKFSSLNITVTVVYILNANQTVKNYCSLFHLNHARPFLISVVYHSRTIRTGAGKFGILEITMVMIV